MFFQVKKYKENSVFYRARISEESGFHKEKMGAPPVGVASSGRANPEGISCLYLSSDIETALNEVRAGVHDFVSVGRFVLKDDIEVVDLKNIDRITPFCDIDYTLHAVNKSSLRRISDEIAKPLRRSDSPLDYIPTQYISDFIKSEKYCGIEFKSAMMMTGYNLAIFDESLFECVEVAVHKIESLSYKHTIV